MFKFLVWIFLLPKSSNPVINLDSIKARVFCRKAADSMKRVQVFCKIARTRRGPGPIENKIIEEGRLRAWLLLELIKQLMPRLIIVEWHWDACSLKLQRKLANKLAQRYVIAGKWHFRVPPAEKKDGRPIDPPKRIETKTIDKVVQVLSIIIDDILIDKIDLSMHF